MSQQLIDRSPDLKRLQTEGYEIEVLGGHLLVRQIPYVNNLREILRGVLVCPLTLANDVARYGGDHVIHFIGERPCNKDGTLITSIEHGNNIQQLHNDITVNFSFSNKPPSGYLDYYDKISTYSTIISSPARSIDAKVSEKTFRVITGVEESSVFNYLDSNSTRANINIINEKLKGQKIAIVGLGGTGSYILDLVSKSGVDEIHVFDGDDFLQHNAFRAPGAALPENIDGSTSKVEYFANVYSRMHNGIIRHGYYLTESKLQELDLMDFVFIAIDNDKARLIIIQHLVKKKIKFIDSGLGVINVDNKLIGTVRVTTCTPFKFDHLSDRLSLEDDDENEYTTNIQIAELNCLNATLAVIKWKKLLGFYQDLGEEHHSTYSINVSQLLNNDTTI